MSRHYFGTPNAIGMRFGVGKRERGAPRSAEHQPALDAKMRAQALEIGDEMRRGVIGERAQRSRLAGAALVIDDDAIERRVVEAPMIRRAAAARSAMQEHDRGAAWIAGLLPVHGVQRIELEPPGSIRGQGRIEEILARKHARWQGKVGVSHRVSGSAGGLNRRSAFAAGCRCYVSATRRPSAPR